MSSNEKKANFLGMPYGTANARLRKSILFTLVKKLGEDICFQCKRRIEIEDELSIEHKKPWEGIDIELFWNLNNISFSHLSCNVAAKRKWNKGRRAPHGTTTRYNSWGCRCEECNDANTKVKARQRAAYRML